MQIGSNAAVGGKVRAPWRRFLLLVIVPVLVWLRPLTALAEPRIALVVGNAHYTALDPLVNPVNDARLVREALKQVGFTVVEVEDADLAGFRRALSEFSAVLSESHDATALFYFAGRGVHAFDQTYLVPVDSALKGPLPWDVQVVGVSAVLKSMQVSGVSRRLVFIDAGRQAPPGTSVQILQRFSDEDAGMDTAVAYSTGPGASASDGKGNISPFAEAFCTAVVTPKLTLDEALDEIRFRVGAATESQQSVWTSVSLSDPFFFNWPD